jgi:hypothetical protein|tara:strand:+ start:285 stop:527 length:243 start_codon:yes stop_codon:yes gene_type:complete
MHIQIGSTVTINKRGSYRDGVVTGISIALSKSDPAGELGAQVQDYDTELGYSGSISYKDDLDGSEYWAYFGQIINESYLK